LSAEEKSILDIERRHWATPGGKEIVTVDELALNRLQRIRSTIRLHSATTSSRGQD
jgi:hypothetical protein